MKKSTRLMKNRLVLQIEDRLGWGSGASWTNKDFSTLSERIFEATGKQLSVTTLKRVWGRVEPIANPSVTTFDILSEFLGYDSWRDFQQRHTAENGIAQRTNLPRRILRWGLGVATVVVLILIVLGGRQEAADSPAAFSEEALKEVSFSFSKVTTGYPNTVIFNYDLGQLAYDSASIQQSWDRRKRIPLTTAKGLVTSTYYQPGYYLAKLVANDQILVERDLYIPTKGWQGMLVGEQEKRYYLKNETLKDGATIRVQDSVLNELDQLEEGYLYLANLADVPVIDGDAFNYAATFRVITPIASSICQYMRMTITGTHEVISLSFSAPGCVGDLSFFLGGEMVSGRNHDLSAFAFEQEQWMTCEVAVQDKQVVVQLNGKTVFKRQLQQQLGKIGGVQWFMEGLGEIRTATLEDSDQQVNLIPSASGLQ